MPFIMHNETKHKHQEKPECDDDTAVPPKPMIGTMHEGEVKRQLGEFGKVVQI